MHVIKFLQKYMVGFVFISVFIVISGIGVTYYQIKGELPRIPKNLRYINQQPPTEIYSGDGKVLKILGDRSYMTLDLISPYFQKAIIAVEDSTFYEHHGLDPVGILRAFYKNTVKGKTKGVISTSEILGKIVVSGLGSLRLTSLCLISFT